MKNPTLKYRWLAVAAMCLIMPCAALAQSDGNFQRLEDILRQSYATSPRLLAAREELKGTHELVPQAQAGWKPTLDATGNITNAHLVGDNFGGDGTTSKEVGLALSQPLYRGGRTVAATRSAFSTTKAQTALLTDLEQRTMQDVATAYMDVLRDTALLNLVRNNRQLIAQRQESADARFRAGDATRTDVAQAAARLAASDAQIAQAEGKVKRSAAAYAQLTGTQPGVLGYPVLSFPFPSTMEAAVEQARQNNPAVTASKYLHEASESDIDTIFGELLPRLSLLGNLDKQYDPQPGLVDSSFSRTVGLSATIPLYEAGATRSRVREAKHTANRRYIETLQAGRDAEQQVVDSWQTLQSARADIAARNAQIHAAGEAREGVHQETMAGTRTILDELDADQEYLDAQTGLVAAKRDEIVAQFALARNLGLLTPQNLGFGGIAENTQVHLEDVQHKILGMDVDRTKGAY